MSIKGFSACILFLSTVWMGMDSYAGVFYCGTVEFVYDEKASVQCEDFPKGTVSYNLKSAGRWNLKRKVTDCTVRVTKQTRGDIRLDGEPLPLTGEVPLARGDVITTGSQSRAEFKISKNAVLRAGSNSKAQLNRDICKSKPTADMTKDLILGPASELLIQILGSGSDFSIESPIAAVGVRGELEPMNKTGLMPVSFTYAAESEESLNPAQVTVPAEWPAGGRVAYMKSYESGIIVVKALRGRV
jgi:hypothetical protein